MTTDNTQQIKVLYIAYYFPPLGSVASIRSLKMVRYLRDQGIEPVVMTLNPRLIRLPKDKGLLKEVPKDTRVYRFCCFDFTWIYKLLWGLRLHKLVSYIQNYLLIPDHFRICRAAAEKALGTVISDNSDIRCAIISGGPFSSFKLGSVLKNHYRIPYICDWRDEWTNNPERLNINYPASSQNKELILEANTIASSAANVFLTDHMRASFASRYGKVITKPFRVIPNGYDEQDFSERPHKPAHARMHILYTGSFYDRRQPDRLWKAVLELIAEGTLIRDELLIDIVGKNSQSFVLGTHAESSDLRAIVRFRSFLPHTETISEMLNADALLLYIPSGANTESVLTGKIFDYLRSGKPIFAVVPPKGIAADYLRKANTGYIADYDSPSEIKERLVELIRDWKSGHLKEIEPNIDFISGFSRQKQASQLADLIREVVTNTNESNLI